MDVTFFIQIGTVALVVVCLLLVLVILVQRSKGGALGSSLAGGAAESAFGADAGSVLTKVTIVACMAFFILVFSLYLAHMHHRGDIDGVRLPEITAPSEGSGSETP